MPIEYAAIAAKALAWCGSTGGKALVSAGVGRVVGKGAERIEKWRKKEPVATALGKALEETCTSFTAVVHGNFGSSPELDARLQVMMEDEPFLAALGRAVVLLDGLDEMFDEQHRHWVREEVWRLVARFRKARFVLTSRPLGYRRRSCPGRCPCA